LKIWYVIFADEPQSEAVHQSWEGWPGALAKFEAARQTGVVEGRYVLGMWVVDQDTHDAHGDAPVVERFGHVPSHVKERHDARQRLLKHPQGGPQPQGLQQRSTLRAGQKA
jgi:hypothetical protein